MWIWRNVVGLLTSLSFGWRTFEACELALVNLYIQLLEYMIPTTAAPSPKSPRYGVSLCYGVNSCYGSNMCYGVTLCYGVSLC